jgi:preprotein translocase subunit SecA
MIKWILQKIVGSKNQREVRRLRPVVARINEIEQALQNESLEALRERTAKWKARLARYHDLEAPPKPAVLRMADPELHQTAADLEAARAEGRREAITQCKAIVDELIEIGQKKRNWLKNEMTLLAEGTKEQKCPT